MFGQFVDRYATDGYGPEVSIVDAIRKAGTVDGIRSLDLNYPFWDQGADIAIVKAALEDAGLRASAVTPAIYTRTFRGGAFTNPDPSVRAQAIDLVRRATEVAHELGADYVKLWPGQDGYDYPFQVDHGALWGMALSGLAEVAGADPGMRFAIEYKPKEPRIHIVFPNAARTLLGIDEIGLDNIGILLDLGHSFNAGESPADALEIVLARGRLFAIDFNDNFGTWDDDLAVGAVHLVETLEFLHTLRRHEWQGIWQLDQFPFREDPVDAARASIRTLTALALALGRLDLTAMREAQERQDALAAQQIALQALIPLEETVER
jgi:sugar phosphate isomerase/epimerase